jgi:hypothetical protein
MPFETQLCLLMQMAVPYHVEQVTDLEFDLQGNIERRRVDCTVDWPYAT